MARNHGYGGPQTVYRLYDENDLLLYVGVTHTPSGRFTQHACSKVWWNDITTIKLAHYPTRREAFRAEAEAIRSENPLHNEALSAAYLDSIKSDNGHAPKVSCPACGRVVSVTPGGLVRRHTRSRYCPGSGLPAEARVA